MIHVKLTVYKMGQPIFSWDAERINTRVTEHGALVIEEEGELSLGNVFLTNVVKECWVIEPTYWGSFHRELINVVED